MSIELESVLMEGSELLSEAVLIYIVLFQSSLTGIWICCLSHCYLLLGVMWKPCRVKEY